MTLSVPIWTFTPFRGQSSPGHTLLVNTAQVVPLLYEEAEQLGADWFELGRRSGYQQLAGENVFESYGVVGHSPARYDWKCFVPKREQSTCALTKYFGKVRGEDSLKVRGIEVRQRSTPSFIESVQRELMEVLDQYREPSPVCDRLQVYLSRFRSGDVNPQELVFRKRASKRIKEYTHGTHTLSALLRYRENGIEKNPGQDVRYVVVDNDVRLPERVRLPFEEVEWYDATVYARELVRAAESIVSSLGWERDDIKRYLRAHTDATLSAFE